jgi:rRNA maturation RNase YbeY
MKVEVFNWNKLAQIGITLDKKGFNNAYIAAFPEVGEKIDVILVDSSEIQKLNRQYRQKNVSTDVLSFNIDSNGVLGEVYISLDYLKSQDRLSMEEVVRMIIHGTLHLMGYDHYNYFSNNENIIRVPVGDAKLRDITTEKIFIEQEKRLIKMLNLIL